MLHLLAPTPALSPSPPYAGSGWCCVRMGALALTPRRWRATPEAPGLCVPVSSSDKWERFCLRGWLQGSDQILE